MEPFFPKSRRKPLIVILAGTALILIGLFLTGCQTDEPAAPEINLEDLTPAQQSYAQIGMVRLIGDDLLPPVVPDSPTQAEAGALQYYQICMACHGNWGQGLTDEWRESGFGGDMNCWASKCHAPNHPPQGFEIPREMPPILGRGSLPTITNGEELYKLILTTMPWWDPGQLSEEQSLDLTAYILNARGELPEGMVLTPTNLSAITMHAPAPELTNPKMGGILLIFGLGLSMATYIWTKQTPDDKDDL